VGTALDSGLKWNRSAGGSFGKVASARFRNRYLKRRVCLIIAEHALEN
jgi:hypothetical protein